MTSQLVSMEDVFSDFSAFVGKANGMFGFNSSESENDYSQYINDPVGFMFDVLKEEYLTDDTQELMQSVADNKVTLGKSGNGTGKSYSSARIAIWFFKTRPRGQVYLASAPPITNLTNILFGEIFTVVARHPHLFEGYRTKTMEIKRSAGSFLAGLSIPSSGTKEQRIAKFSGKHAPDGVLFVNDEASAIPDEVFQGEDTCASDDKSRMLAIFNPHNRSGWTYRAERDGQANVVHLSALNHVQVVTGRDDITSGAVTRNTTVLRINQWTRPLVDGEEKGSGTFELPDYLIGVTCVNQKGEALPPLVAGHYKIVEPSFSTIVLGEYPSAGTNSLVNQDWVDLARTRYDQWVSSHGETAPEYVSANVGADIAEYGVDSNCLCFRYGGFVPPLITWGGVNVKQTEGRIASEVSGKEISRINVDATGLGAGVAPHLKGESLPAVPVKVAESPVGDCDLGKFALLNDELAWRVREWFAGDTAMLPPDEQLMEEILAYTYHVGDDGKVRVSPKSVIKDLLKRSPDKFDSLKLTFYETGAFSGLDLS